MVSYTPQDYTKLREMIVYIAAKSEDDHSFGATKLNKILFNCDFLSFLYNGQSITGQEYQKLDHGPCARVLKPVINSMIEDKEVVQQDRLVYGTHRQCRTLALRDARLGLFQPEEIALIDKVIDDLWDHTAKTVSLMSHTSLGRNRFLGWHAARNGETIPYEAALVGRRKPTAREVEHGQELERTIHVRRQASCQ